MKRLTDIKLFDVFSEFEKLGLGMKSMTCKLDLQNPEDSLTDEEVFRYMEKSSYSKKVNAGSTLKRFDETVETYILAVFVLYLRNDNLLTNL